MKVGDVVQVNLPFQKGAGFLIRRAHGVYRWLVFFKGEMYDFHEHNLEVISDSG